MATDERHDGTSAGTASMPSEIAVQAKQQAVETTDRIKTTTSNRVRSELDTRSTQVADQMTPYVEALNRAGHHLQNQGSSAAGQAAGRLADGIQQLSEYLRNSNSDRLLSDAEAFARKRPWAAGGIGVALGFMGARFLKASAETRYSSTQHPLDRNMPAASTLPPHDMPLSRETTDTAVGGW